VKSYNQNKQYHHANKMVIQKIAQGKQKGTHQMLCLEYTFDHNQKKTNIYLKSTFTL